MPDDPISNPGVPPTPRTPEYGPDKPRLGEGEEAQEPKPFALPPEGGKPEPTETAAERPSPMEVAGEAAKQRPQMSPEEVSDHIQQLQNKLGEINTNLQNPDVTNKFSNDHYEAMNRVVEKMNPDMRAIAKNSQGEFNPPQHVSGETVLNWVTRWINGSQGTLSNALNFLSKEKKPDPGTFLRLQYAVQRATQRGELFSSIVGASVSGVKTIMTTQLG